MKNAYLIAAAALASSPLWAGSQCEPHQAAVIDSEARCVDHGGISIGFTGEDGVKVACMQDMQVRTQCGADGQVTRLHAYMEWFGKLKKFEDQCASEGGTFSYQDPNFAEPQNESFCLQAVPEVGTSMFEEPLCNYRSVCPAVAVLCERPCNEHSIARLY